MAKLNGYTKIASKNVLTAAIWRTKNLGYNHKKLEKKSTLMAVAEMKWNEKHEKQPVFLLCYIKTIERDIL